MKIQKHIEIVRSTKPGLSSLNNKSSKAICSLLRSIYSSVNIAIINDLDDLMSLVARQPDLVFVGMKFLPSDTSVSVWDSPKIWITEILEENNIAFTGSDYVAHRLEQDKSFAKQRIISAGLQTSSYSIISKNETSEINSSQLNYPLFVKPTNRGGGLGIDNSSLVYSLNELQAKTQTLTENHDTDSLVEEYLPGREFSVAIIKDEITDDFIVMPVELIAPKNEQGVRILSAAIKSADTEKFLAVNDEPIKSSVSLLALNAFKALGGRDYGRIDIRLDKFGVPNFLEANLIPSLLEGYGNFPKACLLNAGIDYKTMILQIVRLGLSRSINVEVEIPIPALVPLVA
jgi:D-alanine-D-alanine ligase